MNDLEKAKALLQQDTTCVLYRDGKVYTSHHRGVAPLLTWLDSGIDVRGYSAADRVVGKATAFLYCLLGVTAVYARVMSEPALRVLTQGGICAQYDVLVTGIQNRAKDGPCPLEYATSRLSDAAEALEAIRSTLDSLRQLPS